jgi:hypothetical protein
LALLSILARNYRICCHFDSRLLSRAVIDFFLTGVRAAVKDCLAGVNPQLEPPVMMLTDVSSGMLALKY